MPQHLPSCAVLLVAAFTLAVACRQPQALSLEGAVLVDAADSDEQSPVANVQVSASQEGRLAATRSDSSGFFRLVLPPRLRAGDHVTLEFRHPDYRPAAMQAALGSGLLVARLTPIASRRPSGPVQREIVVANVRVRYTMLARDVLNVGAGVKIFQAVNTGNVPCNKRGPCSPDGKWKAGIGGATLDAGPDNEFREAGVSCIAGPCPFTRIDADNFSQGGRVIGVTVRNWSDTATFVLQAEVVRPELNNLVRRLYPVVLGRTMTFTLPLRAEGPSIEAELGGTNIVFPLGPNLFLRWAACDARPGANNSRIYRCELKPGFRFANQ